MDNNERKTEFSDIPELSEPLKVELKKEFTTNSQLPLEVDRKVLTDARAHFTDIKSRKQSSLRRLRYYAAAVLLLAISIFFVNQNTGKYETYDVNRDGSVDILDAMTLAQHIRDNREYDDTLDFDNDNKLHLSDVELVAKKAVELNDLDQAAAAQINAQLALILN